MVMDEFQCRWCDFRSIYERVVGEHEQVCLLRDAVQDTRKTRLLKRKFGESNTEYAIRWRDNWMPKQDPGTPKP